MCAHKFQILDVKILDRTIFKVFKQLVRVAVNAYFSIVHVIEICIDFKGIG